MNKLLAENSLAIEAEGRIIVEKTANSLVNRVWLENPADIRRELHCGGGLFFEMRLNKLDDLARLVAPKDQTVTVFGFEREELSAFVSKHRPVGINRFVPVGQAMEFSPIWDGYDLLREFCREVDITIRR